ncbi:MAG TPA: phage portal protein [Kineosporiaceae bacterium]|nr:phage portal protein [Kineosporiaceae bacterium]
MGFWDRLRFTRDVAVVSQPTGPQFAIDRDAVPPEIFGLPAYEATVGPVARISRSEAIQVPAVKRARDIVAGTIGALPLNYLSPAFEQQPNPLLSQPEEAVPRSVTMTQTLDDLLFEACAFWRVTARDADGWPVKVRRLEARSVDVRDEQKVFVRRDGSNQGSAWEFVPDEDLIRFWSPNDPLLVAGARAIRTLLRLDAAAARYAEAPMPTGVFTPAEGADADDILQGDEVDEFLADWELKRRQRATAYVSGAVNFNPLQWDPASLQLVETREGAVRDIARLVGISAEDLEVSTTSRTYLNAVQKQQELVNYTLAGYMSAVQDRLSMGDVSAEGFMARFDLGGLVRADEKTRVETYEAGIRVGLYSLETVQRREELPPNEAPAPATPAPLKAVPTPTQEGTLAARAIGGPTFDADDNAHFGFATEAGSLAFEVDVAKREIFGLAVPYGVTTSKGGRKYQFSKGTLKYGAVSRVKLLRDHDRKQAVGKAIELQDTPEGLWARFKVALGKEGDDILQLADDGVYDGLSIGLGNDAKFATRAGVLHAVDAPLAEISILPFPSFDDARVSSVTASADEGKTTMPCTICGHTHAEGAPPCAAPPAPLSLSADTIAAITAAFAAAQPAPPAVVPPVTLEADQPGGKPGPKVIPAAPAGTSLVVKEPVPYRFDGTRGDHDFSSDLINAMRNKDGEAGQRLDKFMSLAFDVDKADVNELNPDRQRPDMYVDNLEFVYPIWDAISKGTLPDSTPFTLPKFNSASGLVAAHVEGVAPTPGSFTTTGQTITPSAVSGRVEITREVWDQGGNPQFSSILWREIVRAYYEALEVAAVDMLDALTPTAIALNGVDSDLDADVTANLAALSYIRGGNRFRDFFLASNLFTALTGAVDDVGRHLYPVLAPQNANGSTEGFFGQVMVGLLPAKPAWALEAGNGGDGSSYLFNRADVHGWATPPRRFDFEYRVEYVDLAVWGYKATANTRLAGVREVTYSAT